MKRTSSNANYDFRLGSLSLQAIHAHAKTNDNNHWPFTRRYFTWNDSGSLKFQHEHILAYGCECAGVMILWFAIIFSINKKNQTFIIHNGLKEKEEEGIVFIIFAIFIFYSTIGWYWAFVPTFIAKYVKIKFFRKKMKIQELIENPSIALSILIKEILKFDKSVGQIDVKNYQLKGYTLKVVTFWISTNIQ